MAPPPGFYPSLRSSQAAPGAQRFVDVTLCLFATAGLSRLTTRRCPSASLRLRANPAGLCPPWALPFAPVHPRGGGVRTLRLFPPTRNSHGGLRPPVMAIPRSSPTGLLRGFGTSLEIFQNLVDKSGCIKYNVTVKAIGMALKVSWIEPDTSEGGKYKCPKFMFVRVSLWRTP